PIEKPPPPNATICRRSPMCGVWAGAAPSCSDRWSKLDRRGVLAAGRWLRSGVVGEDQVLDRRRRAVLGQRQGALLDRLVHRRLALVVLAHVLFPGVDEVVLNEAVRVGRVLVEAPALGTRAPA